MLKLCAERLPPAPSAQRLDDSEGPEKRGTREARRDLRRRRFEEQAEVWGHRVSVPSGGCLNNTCRAPGWVQKRGSPVVDECGKSCGVAAVDSSFLDSSVLGLFRRAGPYLGITTRTSRVKHTRCSGRGGQRDQPG